MPCLFRRRASERTATGYRGFAGQMELLLADSENDIDQGVHERQGARVFNQFPAEETVDVVCQLPPIRVLDIGEAA